MAKPVLTKSDFVKRYKQGEFGNRPPTWDSYKEWFEAEDRMVDHRLYHLRNRIPGGKTFYNIPGYNLWMWSGSSLVHDPKWYVTEMAPTKYTIIQGELNDSWDLTYSMVKRPMRDALAERTEHASGLLAKFIVQYYMDDKSWEWLRCLMEEYPDHTIEFSTYSVKCGVEGMNTYFWEVRKY